MRFNRSVFQGVDAENKPIGDKFENLGELMNNKPEGYANFLLDREIRSASLAEAVDALSTSQHALWALCINLVGQHQQLMGFVSDLMRASASDDELAAAQANLAEAQKAAMESHEKLDADAAGHFGEQ